VDVVINVVNLGEYSETLREQFVGLGLREDVREGAPVCRWLLDDLIVDIMPTRGDILGFSCEWYQLAFDTARPISLPNGVTIRLVTPACFLATKLTAFADRGRRNPMASHDLEDVIAVIDGRPEIVGDVAAAPTDLRAAIALQATRGGVCAERLDFDPLCTVGDPMHFSYRRGGPRSGRMSCVIGLS
jgi:hypothetical protein